jgi:hypothetical protein
MLPQMSQGALLFCACTAETSATTCLPLVNNHSNTQSAITQTTVPSFCLQERMRRLEALRLELDSRRRTVADLQGRCERVRANLGTTRARGEVDMEITLRKMQVCCRMQGKQDHGWVASRTGDLVCHDCCGWLHQDRGQGMHCQFALCRSILE